jgi:hypothetical protein
MRHVIFRVEKERYALPLSAVREVVVSPDWDLNAVSYPAVLDPLWSSTCSMSDEVSRHDAVRLKDGRVLVVRPVDDPQRSSPFGNIYDPKTGTWATTQDHAAWNTLPAVVLPDGRVLTAYLLFDPATGRSTTPGGAGYFPFTYHRVHSLTALDNGKAVAFGGHATGPNEGGAVTGGGAIFDPGTDKWTFLPAQIGIATAGHTAVKLADGRVLVAGGEYRDGRPHYCNYVDGTWFRFDVRSIAEARIYDPAAGTITLVAPMNEPRLEPQGVLLANGKVLVVGAWRCESRGCPLMGCEIKRNENPAEVYDPVRNTWEAVRAPDLDDTPRGLSWGIGGVAYGPATYYQRQLDVVPLVRLPDGNVLRAGPRPSLFDPNTGRWFAVPDYLAPHRRHASATLLETGKVLVAGGTGSGNPPVQREVPTSSAELYEGGRLGAACSAGVECVTGHCVDGVCCESACSGLCQACSSAKKGPGTLEGRCAPILKGSDPDSECEPIGSGVCQTLGTCDGAGACLTKAGEAVGAKTCADPFTTPGYPTLYANVVFDSCNERGEPVRGITRCSPGACGGGQCSLRCTDDWECKGGDCNYWRICGEGYGPPNNPSTVPGSKGNGAPCTAGSECASTHCVEGVCCDMNCAYESCRSCLASLKASGPDGVCGPVKEGTDPHGGCTISTDCSSGGLCGANGACAPKSAGSACGDTVCQDATTISGSVCDQNAQCVQGTGSCGAYACGNNVCKFCCASSADCAPSFVCRECACIPPLPAGAACTSADQCQSGFCADGRCCDTACSGQCEACDLAGSEGTCSAVSGAPRGARAACAAANDSPCAGSCNGVERAACSYPSSSTECAPAACAEGSVTTSSCDGQGSCVATIQSCNGFGCDGDQCRTTCAQASDCAPGYRCNASVCTNTTDGDAGETPPDGASGDPGETGDASSDSPSGSGGSGGAGGSRPHKPPPDDGCSIAARKPSGGWWLGFVALAAALGAMGVRRRRRGERISRGQRAGQAGRPRRTQARIPCFFRS